MKHNPSRTRKEGGEVMPLRWATLITLVFLIDAVFKYYQVKTNKGIAERLKKLEEGIKDAH